MLLRKFLFNFQRKVQAIFLIYFQNWKPKSKKLLLILTIKLTIFFHRSLIGVESYGISMTTLEEVFMKVASITQPKSDENSLRQLASIKTQGQGSGFFTQVPVLLR